MNPLSFPHISAFVGSLTLRGRMGFGSRFSQLSLSLSLASLEIRRLSKPSRPRHILASSTPQISPLVRPLGSQFSLFILGCVLLISYSKPFGVERTLDEQKRSTASYSNESSANSSCRHRTSSSCAPFSHRRIEGCTSIPQIYAT